MTIDLLQVGTSVVKLGAKIALTLKNDAAVPHGTENEVRNELM